MAEIDELRASLQKLRAVTGIIADELDLDPAETKVRVKAVTPGAAQRPLAEVSLAECFAEADALLRLAGAGDGPSN